MAGKVYNLKQKFFYILFQEAVMILLDVGSSMYEKYSVDNIKTRLELGVESVSLLLQQKILYNHTHECGLILFGADEAEDGNIIYIRDLGKVDFDFIRNTNELTQHDVPKHPGGDIFDALDKSISYINEYVKKKKYLKKIYIMTNGRGSTQYKNQDIQQLIQLIHEQNIKVNVIAIDFCNSIDLEDDINSSNFKPDPNQTPEQNQNQKYLMQLSDQCEENVLIVTAKQAIQIYKRFRAKSIFPRCKLRTELEITSKFKCSVMVYTKTQEQRMPPLKKYSKVSNFDKDQKANLIIADKSYYVQDDSLQQPVDDQFRIKGYYYGKKLVPVSKLLEDKLKYGSQKCLKLLGFVKKSSLPRQYYMGGVDMVVPINENENDQRAFSALVTAMMELSKVAFVRYCTRDNSAPKLACLIPHRTEKYKCFWLICLPTAEDIRDYQFQSLKECTLDQEKAAADLIDAMDLTQLKDENGETYEAVKPNCTFNPILQYYYQTIIDKAVYDEKEMKPLNFTIDEYVHPEKKLMKQFAKEIDNFKSKFRLKENIIKKEKLRVGWDKILEMANQLQQEDEGEKAKIQLEIEGEEEIQKNKEEIGIKEEEEEQQVIFNKKFNFEDENKDVIQREISSMRPIADFNKMMSEKREDLVDSAIKQMKEIINNFVLSCDPLFSVQQTNALQNKALDCLIELRKGCVQQDEPEEYNNFMQELKQKFSTGSHKVFWAKVVKSGITLIMSNETNISKVTAQQAADFLKDQTVQVSQMALTSMEQQELEEEIE